MSHYWVYICLARSKTENAVERERRRVCARDNTLRDRERKSCVWRFTLDRKFRRNDTLQLVEIPKCLVVLGAKGFLMQVVNMINWHRKHALAMKFFRKMTDKHAIHSYFKYRMKNIILEFNS